MDEGGETKDKARRVGLRRCPYCHDDVAPDEGASVTICAGCHAAHHQACWQEAGACSACGATGCLVAVRERLFRGAAERVLTGAGYGARDVARVLRDGRARRVVLVVLGAVVAVLLVFVRLQSNQIDEYRALARKDVEHAMAVEEERDVQVRDAEARLREALARLARAEARLAWAERSGPLEVVVQPDAVAFANRGEGLLKVFLGAGASAGTVEPRRTLVVPLYHLDARGELVRVTGGHVQVGDGPLVPFSTEGGDTFVLEGGRLRRLAR